MGSWREIKQQRRKSTYIDMLLALQVKTKLSEKIIRKVYGALIEYIMEEIQMQNIVQLKNLGSIYCNLGGGYTKKMPDIVTGELTDRFIKPFVKVKFHVSENLENAINEPFKKQMEEEEKAKELIESDSMLKEKKLVLVKNLILQEAQK